MKWMPKRMSIAIPLVCMCLGWGAIRWSNAISKPSLASDFTEGELADCPDRPNCVCTSATQPQHQIEPIKVDAADPDPMAVVKSIVEQMPRSRVVDSGNDYLRAEFRSAVFGFVDDLELKLDDSAKFILARSASRIGYSDLGVNRLRVEEIRNRYESR